MTNLLHTVASSHSRTSLRLAAVLLTSTAFAVPAWGDAWGDEAGQQEWGLAQPSSTRRAAQDDAPVLLLTHSARGTSAGRYGASARGSSTLELSGDVSSESQFGGGLRLWGAPIDRVTLLAQALRRDNGEPAPAFALQVRILENRAWAFAALGRYKAEGFAEVEGELEAGLLGSYVAGGLYLDLNVVAGRGFEEEETDGELSFRSSYEALGPVRVGVEGRARTRLAGVRDLSGGRRWDALGGPQLTASFDHFYAGALTGPTTVGVAHGVGWSSMLTFGGVM